MGGRHATVRAAMVSAMSRRPVRRALARLFLMLTGWKPEGLRPDVGRFVLIAAPHTSNWDFLYLLAFGEVFDLELHWVGKHSLFRGLMSPVMRWLGGLPVRRDRRENLVVTLARLFEERETLGLAVPAEGTRGFVDHWKSGFYHIAREARVPIVMSFLDYERKRGGFGPGFEPSGDVRADMDIVRAFYADKKGKFPEQFGTICLLEEKDPAGGSQER